MMKGRHKWLRWLALIAGLLFVGYTLFGFLGVPMLMRQVGLKQANEWFTGTFNFEKASFNPFTFKVVVEGFSLEDPEGTEVAGFREFRGDYQITSLLTGRITFKELYLGEPFMEAVVDAAGNVSLLSALQLNEPRTQDADETADTESGAFEIPAIHIDNLEMDRARLRLRYEGLSEPIERSVTDLSFQMVDVHSAPEFSNPYDFTLTTSLGEQLSIRGDLQLDPLSSRGQISIEGFQMADFSRLATDSIGLDLASARFDFTIDYHFEPIRDEPRFGFSHGTLALRDVEVRGKDASEPSNRIDAIDVDGIEVDLIGAKGSVERVAIVGGRHFFERDENGDLNILLMLLPSDGSSPSAQPKPQSTLAGAGAGSQIAAPLEIRLGVRSGQMDIGLALSAAWGHVVELLSSPWDLSLGSLELEGQRIIWVDRFPARPAGAVVDDLRLSLKDISNQPGAEIPFEFSLDLAGGDPEQLGFNSAAPVDGGRIELGGTVHYQPNTLALEYRVSDLPLALGDGYVSDYAEVVVRDGRLQAEGGLTATLAEDNRFAAEARAGLAVEAVKVDYANDDRELLSFEALTVADVQASLGDALQVRTGPVVLQRPVAQLTRNEDGGLNIAEIVKSPAADDSSVTALADGSVVDAAADAGGAQDAVEPPSPEEVEAEIEAFFASLPDVFIESFMIEGGVLRLEDKMAEPHAEIQSAYELSLVPIDLSGTTMTDIAFSSRLSKAAEGSTEVVGKTLPSNPFRSTQLSIKNDGVTLPSFQSDSIQLLGSPVTSGVLKADNNYQVTDYTLTGTNVIEIDRLRFGARVPETEAPNLPLGLGIAVLEDRKGIMRIDIPIPESKVTDPRFSVMRVIQRAIGVVLTKVATAPFSVLGSAFGGGEVSIPEEIEFAAGSAAIDPGYTRPLELLATALYDRPALGLVLVPGVDLEADAPVLRRAKWEQRVDLLVDSGLTREEAIVQLYLEAHPDFVADVTGEAPSAASAEPIEGSESESETNEAGQAAVAGEPETSQATPVQGKRTVRRIGRRLVFRVEPVDPEPTVETRENAVAEATESAETAEAPAAKAGSESGMSGYDIEAMEAELVAAISVQTALEQLALDRARAVQEAVLAAGEVEAERFSVEPLDDDATNAARVRLKLGLN